MGKIPVQRPVLMSRTGIHMADNQRNTADYVRIIRPRHGLAALDWRELWRFRELFLFLVWRDILVRYKQAYLGIAWAVLQPVLTTLVFTILFGYLAKFKENGIPYSVLVMAGLLPWQFFANALSESSQSLISSERLITKVYFPRLIVPSSAVVTGLVDFGIGLCLLAILMLANGVAFTPALLMLPLFFFVAFLAALAAGLWFSALNVKYRDVKYIVPFLVRIGMYVSPVGFVSTKVPEQWRFIYSMNPMVGVIDGFRWCILGPAFEPNWTAFAISIGVILVMLAGGAIYFRSTERTFADVI